MRLINLNSFVRKEIFKISVKQVQSPVAYCALTTGVGTRDEEPYYNGLAHFTEHMVFKGTVNRGSTSINNALEKVGGELNAYTTKEETVLQATVLREDLYHAVDLLLEMAFTSVFPPKELEKEREVILDEIVSYKDAPSEAIYDQFETLLFGSHSLSMPILGEKKTLKRIDSAILKKYLTDNFVPSKMGFTVVADIESDKVVAMIEKSLAKYYKEEVQVLVVAEGEGCSAGENGGGEQNVVGEFGGTERDIVAGSDGITGRNFIELASFGENFYTEISKKNHQAHCMVGTTAYSCFEQKRLALSILTNILGGPASNARLNMTLREKNALVYNVEAGYTPYADTGIFTVYFGCDKADVKKCLELTRQEIDKMVAVKLSDSALKAAKKQLFGQLSIAQDNAESQCLSMGKSLIVYGRINTFNQIRAKIEEITAEQLQEVAREVLCWDRMSILVYC
ncbi:MAG: pitrilysin family protein [Bacteroidales bacterium]